MRTGYVVGGQIKPGRQDEAVAQAQEAVKLFEGLGAEEVVYRLGGGGTVDWIHELQVRGTQSGRDGRVA